MDKPYDLQTRRKLESGFLYYCTPKIKGATRERFLFLEIGNISRFIRIGDAKKEGKPIQCIVCEGMKHFASETWFQNAYLDFDHSYDPTEVENDYIKISYELKIYNPWDL